MKRLRATYTVVTPMFLGGADPGSSQVAFRPPSFKGALRFWWRALAWGEVGEGTREVAAALRELHRSEAELFGSAAGEHTGGQSRVLLSADWRPGSPVSASAVRAMGPGGEEDGIGYLMGQGLRGRSAVGRGEVEICATFRPGTGEQDRTSVERALILLGLLGGLGSRARRGFGSLAIEKLEGDRLLDIAVPRTVEELRPTLAELVGNRARSRPPYTAFSAQSRIDHSFTEASAPRALAAVGGEMRDFRQTIDADTRRARDAADGKKPDQPPDRSIFGLPLQFYFKRDGATVFAEPATRKDEKLDRRGSPLLIHVHPFRGESDAVRYGVLQTFLPARFLPDGKGVQVRRKNGPLFPFHRFIPPEALIVRYLDAFPERVTVLE